MSTNLRKRARINYYEPEEPAFDEYIYCEDCEDFVYEYCSIHGPLLVIPDNKVPTKTGLTSYVARAALTIPNVFLHLAPSIIPGAGLGVFSTLTLPRGVRFGPYQGHRTQRVNSMYCWQIYDRNRKRSHVLDAANADTSNWIRYVNCARHCREQNLVAFQYQGQLYYRTIKIIPRFTELMVFYGSEFANTLNINLSKYNSYEFYDRFIGAKNKIDQTTEILPKQVNTGYKTDATNDNEIEISGRLSQELNAVVEDKLVHVFPEEVNTAVEDNYLESNSTSISETYFSDEKFDFIEDSDEEFYVNEIKAAIETEPILEDINSVNISNNNFNRSKNPIPTNILDKELKNESFKSVTLVDGNIIIKFNNDTSLNHKCETCNRIYTSKHNLNRHLYNVHKIKKYTCKECEFKTNLHYKYKEHSLKHYNDIIEHTCTKCNKRFNSKKNLTRHLQIHEELKKHACSECGYKTNERYRFNRHLLSHNLYK